MGRRRKYASGRERLRAFRARQRASAAHRLDAPTPAVVAVVDHADPVGALVEWSRTALVVPPGHPRSGEPLELLPFAVDWLRDTWDVHESALSTARKNAKSAICAILALAYLVGPLRRPGWRGAIASVSKEKAGELRRQVREIAEASGLDVRIRRSPYPGVIESSTGSLDTLSADRTAGHAGGYDLVVVDECGLLPERARDLLAGLRSSVSARNGKIRHISIRGDSPLFREILENPATKAHIFAASDDCAVDDEAAWRSANPALGIVKSIAYMRAEVERIRAVPSDEASFRALDLNLEISPSREMVCSPDDLRACFADEIDRRGSAHVGIDVGEAGSGNRGGGVLACYWRLENLVSVWRYAESKGARQARRRRLCRNASTRRTANLPGPRGSGKGIRRGPSRRPGRRQGTKRGCRCLPIRRVKRQSPVGVDGGPVWHRAGRLASGPIVSVGDPDEQALAHPKYEFGECHQRKHVTPGRKRKSCPRPGQIGRPD